VETADESATGSVFLFSETGTIRDVSTAVRSRGAELRPFVLVGWIVLVLASQAWPTWGTGIRQLFASDVVSYEAIANAAPELPSASIAAQHAQRFPVHWLVGTIASTAAVNLHVVYRLASVLCLLGVLLVMFRIFVAIGLGVPAFTIASGLVVTSVYAMRYLLAAPGMLSDAVFLLGFSLLLLGFTRQSRWLVVVGISVAASGRQTAIPLGIVAALAILFTWEGRRRRTSAFLVLAACLGIYLAEWLVARTFSTPGSAGLRTSTLIGPLGHPVRLLLHGGIVGADARGVLGVLIPLAVIAGAWLRGRRPAGIPTLLTASVLVQPFLLSPAWVGKNEPRLASLALPGLALIAAEQLRDLWLSPTTVAVVSAAILIASFHPRFSDVGTPDTAVWAVLDVAAAAVITLAIGRRAVVSSSPAMTA
jgi:hypothetical protein